MREVKIPNDYRPYVVEVNGVTYKFTPGATVEVPDEVAEVIENYWKLHPTEKPVDGGVLPYVTKANNGEVLKVEKGVWTSGEDAGGMANPMTTAFDMVVGGTDGEPERLAAGNVGEVLTMGQSGPAWEEGFENPIVSPGDLIVGGTLGSTTRLAKGSEGQFLSSTSSGLAWVTIPAANGNEF